MIGLSTTLAENSLSKFGKNVLIVKSAHPWWKILFSQFTDFLVIILIVAAGISFTLGERIDAIVIFIIVIINASIGFFQEFRTERTIAALKKMIKSEIRVYRDGKEVLMSTELLVPDDVIVLAAGDKIPADATIIESHSLRVEESSLTGESLPVEKKLEDSVYMGTSVVRGSGICKIMSTGMNTKFGEIAKLTTETKKSPSPLQIELRRIGIFVTKITGIICLGLFFIGILRGSSMIDSLLFAVSVAIAAVPEGLPTTITIALALGASVLARKKAVVKKLTAVETLGAVTTICSDKTGTLTKNEMTARRIYLGDRSIYEISGVGYNPNLGKINFIGGNLAQKENITLKAKFLEICQKCTESKLIETDGEYSVLGDPTEGACLTLVKKSGQIFPLEIDEIFPFDSERKMMSVIAENKILVKGSPDQVLEKCTYWTDGTKISKLTPEKIKQIKTHYERMAENALRVLAFAERTTCETEKVLTEIEAEKDLVFVGLLGMIDPPRSDVRAAVKKCHTAGIRIIVITGDAGVTAEAIARELNIVQGKNVRVLSGKEVKKMADKELLKLLSDKKISLIFARSLPEQKMRIVRLLQKLGEVVAMTGDGVNDAPALRAADIGIAMGITGTEVSKSAATMILTNDSFASIVTAVEEGRRIYENLKKFVWFIFSCNIGELVVVFLAIFFQFPLPLTAILILCIDLGTDILPAIALGVDNAETDLMQHPPRDTQKRLLNKRFVLDFLIMGLFIGGAVTTVFLIAFKKDGNLMHARTIAFSALVLVQLLNAFSARSFTKSFFRKNPFGNMFLILAIYTSILMVVLMVYSPILNSILKTTSLLPKDLFLVFCAAVIPFVFIEILKISGLRAKMIR
jgi:Ca2+-transporting ATPase